MMSRKALREQISLMVLEMLKEAKMEAGDLDTDDPGDIAIFGKMMVDALKDGERFQPFGSIADPIDRLMSAYLSERITDEDAALFIYDIMKKIKVMETDERSYSKKGRTSSEVNQIRTQVLIHLYRLYLLFHDRAELPDDRESMSSWYKKKKGDLNKIGIDRFTKKKAGNRKGNMFKTLAAEAEARKKAREEKARKEREGEEIGEPDNFPAPPSPPENLERYDDDDDEEVTKVPGSFKKKDDDDLKESLVPEPKMKVLHNGAEWKVVQPKTRDTAKDLGWDFRLDNFVYIFFNKHNGQKYYLNGGVFDGSQDPQEIFKSKELRGILKSLLSNAKLTRNGWSWKIEDDDYERWFLNGKLHREDGPAYTFFNGGEEFRREEWYKHGVQHREDGPALIDYEINEEEWFRNGKHHREDGPAIIHHDEGSYFWLNNGELHREDGPAVIKFFGKEKKWYLHGVEMSPDKIKSETKPKQKFWDKLFKENLIIAEAKADFRN